MIRLARFWLPVVPIVMAVLFVLYDIPDLSACPARGGLLILCQEWPSAVGPVDLLGGAQTLEGTLRTGMFALIAVAVAVVGIRRIRGTAR